MHCIEGRPGGRISGYAFTLAFALVLALPVTAQAQNLMLFAAVSLKDVLEEIVRSYDARPGSRVLTSFAASSALARQIEQGAPADIFVSADTEWMDYLLERNRIDPATRRVLAGNRLALIAPAARAPSVPLAPRMPLVQMLGGGRLAIADPEHVPAGRYARAALIHLGLWDAVHSRLAPADNVRAALNFVARGEAPLGIVYRTDAAAEKRVGIVGIFPADSHPDIRYPAGVVAASRQPQEARRLLAHLQSSASAAVFMRYGFATAP